MRNSLMSSLLVLVMVGLLAGCASVKRATGQLDDSVLPGERENVLPPEQQTARDPGVTGKRSTDSLSGDDSLQSQQSNCLPDEPNCISQSDSIETQ